MERHANYALVGATTLLLMVGLIGFVIWLAQVQFSKAYDFYDIVFVGPVRGLTEGGEVHFNGIKVGEVSKISLDKVDPRKVIARARVNSDVPIHTDSYATLEPQGITGVNYVQITAGTTNKPLLKDVAPAGQVPILRTQSSALSDLLEGGGALVSRSIEALNRVNRVLSDDNIKTVGTMLHDVQGFTAELKARKELIADADATLKSIDQTSQSIRRLSDSSQTLVNGDGKKALHDLADAATELKGAATDTRAMIAKLQGPTQDFATTGLPQLTSAIVTLQSAAESLDRLVGEVEQNPSGVLTKTPAQTVEVKP